MTKEQQKLFGIIGLVLCVICIFFAVERYSANADAVEALNTFQQSSLFGEVLGGGELEPSTPASTKYGIFFAAIFGGGGAYLLIQSSKRAE